MAGGILATVMFTARRIVLRRPMIKVKNLDVMFSHSCPLFSVIITELSIKLGFLKKLSFTKKTSQKSFGKALAATNLRYTSCATL